MTTFSKITVLKSLGLSNSTYIMYFFPNIGYINKQIEKIRFCLKNFALKVNWLNNLMENKDHNFRWKILPQYHLNYLGPKFLELKISFLKDKELQVLRDIPLFHQQCISAWKKCQHVDKSCNEVTNIIMQLYWGNTYIKDQKLCLWWILWLKSGILFIGNIIDATGDWDINRAKELLCIKHNYLCEVGETGFFSCENTPLHYFE